MGKLSTSRAEDQRAFAVVKQYITDAEVEKTYAIARKTLSNWRILGRGPEYRKFGGAVRYNVRSLEDWIQAQPCGGNGVPASAVRGA